ncbi:MAG: TIGR03943 family protein [Eubacteriales bacterium]|nr:TIGR03943 family protein [Eubacteriales bacterium]
MIPKKFYWKKPWNLQVLLELATQAFFTGVMLYLIISREYLKYVTPRLLPYLIGMIVVMVFWMGATARRLRSFSHRPRFIQNFILLLPALFFILPHDPGALATTGQSTGNALAALTASPNSTAGAGNQTTDPQGKGSQAPGNSPTNSTPAAQSGGNTRKAGQTAKPIAKEQPELQGTKTEAGGIITADGLYHIKNQFGADLSLSGLDPAAKHIEISHKDFYHWLSEIFTHQAVYQGYTISVSGFVYHDESLNDRFLLARNMMTCCVADLAPAGIICQADEIPTADSQTWFTMTGTISSVTTLGRTEPLLIVNQVVDCEVPNDPYIYPF